MVRVLMPVARGIVEVPARRSTTSDLCAVPQRGHRGGQAGRSGADDEHVGGGRRGGAECHAVRFARTGHPGNP